MKLLLLTALLTLTACKMQKADNKTVTAPAILGGDVVDANADIAKSTVMIYNISEKGVSGCTGTILSKSLILTAAHCTTYNPKELYVVFGADAPQLFDYEQGTVNSKFDKNMIRRVFAGRTFVTWPTLDPRSKSNWGDLAVLRILGNIPEGFEPVEFLDPEFELEDGMDVVLAGFGTVTDGKFSDEGQPIEPGVGATVLNHVTVTIRDANYSETEVLMEQTTKRGACHGDSGGPAFVEVDGKLKQFGITSRGTLLNGSCVDGSIYTNVLNFAKFINKAAKELLALTKPEPIPQP